MNGRVRNAGQGRIYTTVLAGRRWAGQGRIYTMVSRKGAGF
jgi:hypothetical protein